MSAIQGRNRKNVHESKNDGKHGSHAPKRMPIPYGRKERSNGSETAKILISLVGEKITEIGNIASEGSDTQTNAFGERLRERKGVGLEREIVAIAKRYDTDMSC